MEVHYVNKKKGGNMEQKVEEKKQNKAKMHVLYMNSYGVFLDHI